MSSFIFHPEQQQEEMKVTSSIIQKPHQEQHQSLAISKRMTQSLQSNSSIKKLKKSKLQRGLTYGASLQERQFQEEDEDYNGQRLTKSFKIVCSGPAKIVTDIQELNYQYLPKKKSANTSSLRSSHKVQKIQAPANPQKRKEPEKQNEPIQPVQRAQQKIWQQILKERPSKSWDIEQKEMKKIHIIWFIIFVIVLLLIITSAHPKSKANFDQVTHACSLGIFQ